MTAIIRIIVCVINAAAAATTTNTNSATIRSKAKIYRVCWFNGVRSVAM